MVFDKIKSDIGVQLSLDKAKFLINNCSQPASQPASQPVNCTFSKLLFKPHILLSLMRHHTTPSLPT